MAFEDHEGTEVAGGKHVVPDGVAVEELDGGKKKLSEICPEALAELLDKKNLRAVYDAMVANVVAEGKTRSLFGKWQDGEFVAIIDSFAEEFGEKGVKVALCKRKAGSGTKRWLEFIDVDTLPTYVPQYDVSNLSGQKIKTMYTTLEFPTGVAVEELKRYGKARSRLREKCPPYVEKLLESKGLMEEYNAFVEDIAAQCKGTWKKWNKETLLAVVDAHKPQFEAKGVTIFIGMKDEYVSHGQYGGHMEYFRWIEFVDREAQPNYFPQRDADTKEDGCVIC